MRPILIFEKSAHPSYVFGERINMLHHIFFDLDVSFAYAVYLKYKMF